MAAHGRQATVPVCSSRSATVLPLLPHAVVATVSASVTATRTSARRPIPHPRLTACSVSARRPIPRSSPRCCTKPSTGSTTEPRNDRRWTRCSRFPRTHATSTHWGRAGDVALSALDRRDEPVGAIWMRRFDADAPGYGYVADDIPELAIGVYPEFRGQRVGTLLMGSLIARAERDHVRGDQPQRPSRQSCETAVRPQRLRGRDRRRPARSPCSSPSPDFSTNSCRTSQPYDLISPPTVVGLLSPMR